MDWKNNNNSDPIKDLETIRKWMIEMCQMCGGTRHLTVGGSPAHPELVKCKYCDGTGKLPQYRNPENEEILD